MPTFSQKRVWHSFLKSKSPLVISLKGEPQESKYGDNPIVYFEVRGDDFDGYYYEIESPEVNEIIENTPKREWLTVTASGGKDNQHIAFSKASGGPVTSNKPGMPMVDKDYSTGNISGDYQRCLSEARGIALEWADDFDSPIPAEAIHAMAATMFIQWSYTKFRRPLNADDAETVEVVDAVVDKTDEYVEDIRGLISQLESTSGTAHDDSKLKTMLNKIESSFEGTIDEALHARMTQWLFEEIDHQTLALDDELPF